MVRSRSSEAPDTRNRVIQATLETLHELGFTRTTARAIARQGGFNQGVIYYYFPSLNSLLVAALEATSQARLNRYRAELKDADTISRCVEVVERLYEEDLASGHVFAVQEIVAGSSGLPDLRAEIIRALDPWVEFSTEVLGKLLARSPFGAMLDPADAAYALVALYFGLEGLTHLNGDRVKAQRLFDAGRRLAPLVDSLLLGVGDPSAVGL